ncbi:hypothetical protein GJR96_07575 [Haloferax sp. MBLA0076]|uniref:Uncharacterized protein n=1 Tax=Haloferax litoreum TaxID=2666140 RepID=A0A6A8GEJ0_9EURY|nr:MULTISPECIES: hypothetical protein [Haloferax]KAB1193309.1 hypothetical protein Hfx1148_07565 [Haloferax sp. CBA1148]MRX21814.1 hypothetical protein [Haloferax litoreum]
MGDTPRERFGDLVRAASPSERRRFVADVWAARGWETTVDGSFVVARTGTQTRRIALVAGGWFGVRPRVPDEVDVVVALDAAAIDAADSTPGVRVFSLDDLYDLLRYGLPSDVGNRLVETHFGTLFADQSATTWPGRFSFSSRFRSARSGIVLVAVAALLALAIVATAGVPGVVPGLGGGTEQPQSDPSSTPMSTVTPEPWTIAPGVTTAGIENATLLANAHRRAVTNESYRWTVVYRESIAGDETGREVEVVRVEAPHVYTSEVQRVGRLRAFPRPTATEDSYADGSMRYARRPNEPDGIAARVLDPDVRDGPGRHATRGERYVEWYLSTERSRVVNSTVEDGVVVYRVEGTVNEFPRSRDYEFTALVEESGFVRSTRVSYETRDGLGVTVWFEYDAVGETTVTPPQWVGPEDRPTNGTAEDGVANRTG